MANLFENIGKTVGGFGSTAGGMWNDVLRGLQPGRAQQADMAQVKSDAEIGVLKAHEEYYQLQAKADMVKNIVSTYGVDSQLTQEAIKDMAFTVKNITPELKNMLSQQNTPKDYIGQGKALTPEGYAITGVDYNPQGIPQFNYGQVDPSKPIDAEKSQIELDLLRNFIGGGQSQQPTLDRNELFGQSIGSRVAGERPSLMQNIPSPQTQGGFNRDDYEMSYESGNVNIKPKKKEDGKVLSPGQLWVNPDGSVVAKVPKVEDTPKQVVIQNNKTKQQKYIAEGSEIPTGWNVINPATAKIEGSDFDAGELANLATGYRKEFDNLSKEYYTIRDSYNRVLAASKDPSAAGDLALIFNYMKILDPGSVVRESEFANAENARGVPASIRNIYNKVLSGEKLEPETQRPDFIKRAKMLYEAQEQIQKTNIQRFTQLAKKYNIDPNEVIAQPYEFGNAPQTNTVDTIANEFGF